MKRKRLKIVCLVLVIALTLMEVGIIIYYADNFINGYTPSDIVGMPIGEKVYGWQAITEDGWANLLFVPIICVTTIVQGLYIAIILRHKRAER